MRRLPLVLLILLWALPAVAGPYQATVDAARDIRTVPRADRKNIRYFWDPEDPATKIGAKNLQDDEVAFQYHLNRTSRRAKFARPHKVSPTLWRVDVSDVGWDRRVLDVAADIDPYFHEQVKKRVRLPVKMMKKGKAKARFTTKVVSGPASWLPRKDIDHLISQTRSQAPILNMRWFFANTARQLNLSNKETGLGYYNLLGIGNRQDYFDLIGLIVNESVKRELNVRAALGPGESKVANNGRQFERNAAITGGEWSTFDTDDPTGTGAPTANLLRGEFKHKAEERYGRLPNGLDVTIACDNKGVLQAKVPDFVGADESKLNISRDRAIHPNLGCLRCHNGEDGLVLRNIGVGGKCSVRLNYEMGTSVWLASPIKRVRDELERLYLGNLSEHLAEDRSRYVRATQLATVTLHTPKGLEVKAAAAIYAGLWNRQVEAGVTLEQAAVELGCTSAEVVKAFKIQATTVRGLDPLLAPFIHKTPRTISRITFEDKYRLAQYYMRGDSFD